MNDPLKQYLKFSNADRHPHTPALEVILTAPRNFYTESPNLNLVTVTITRSEKHQEPKPCYFYWSPSTDEGFRVFRDSPSEGLMEVEVQSDCPSPITRQSNPLHLWYLGADDEAVSWEIPLGETLSRSVIKSEWITYELFWPGGEVHLWDWGSNDTNKETLEVTELEAKSTPMTLPGGARCSFTLIEGSAPPPRPRRSSSPVLEVDPNTLAPGVPILTLEIEAPPTWRTQEAWPLTWKLTYHGVSGDGIPRPITFSVNDLYAWEASCFYRRSPETGEWNSWRSYCTAGYAVFEEEDVPCAVGTSDGFMSLQPNETWTEVRELETMIDLPEDARDGEVMRHLFKGCRLSWWDWGTKEDHIDTIVSVIGFGVITSPPDNDGRPEVVIPASDMVEFTVVN
ncbi:hypothetical protein BO83DRAFT_408482 [Aspergillus eucalypticola CBS 122712]|uniref:Uncharacterized protein n=1 Tax=Aspergillus eucalypticola (strain CBS 122712 / IBT 29274) TaxID=1448314 RepID=A0A317VIE2_ASPEC|nr:uncharacterized protein BO83DRAFT_408482 [Aspergillus eucalypticola CBS 122712]PWY72768.1 hypothetical protein BO83DRAFT_408482 [Aspergillus eucalypticola CBS 122712]